MGDAGTCVHVTLSHNPVTGAAGHALASLLGNNPRRQLDQDLARMTTLLETGRAAHDAARPK